MLNVSVLPIYIDAEHIRNAKPAKKPFDFTTTPFVPLEDNARSATGQNVWGFTILWVGRLEPEKNLALALESVAWFLRTHQNAGLVVVGDGGKRAVMERYAALLGLQKHVVFIGWQKDIASWYAAADVLLVTSEYEGYGRHIVEARSAGMPVVSTDVGVARETGSFIADANAQSLAGQLQDVHEGAQAPAYQYPYADTQAYLSALKRAWNTCARRETF